MSQFEMTFKRTQRGFAKYEFSDRYQQKCSLQDSSLAGEAIWLGVDNTGPHISGPGGNFNEDVLSRMYLTTPMVKELVAKLQHFLDSGYVDPNIKEDADDGEEVEVEAERSSPSRCHALRVALGVNWKGVL
jgi:hypothetical protein